MSRMVAQLEEAIEDCGLWVKILPPPERTGEPVDMEAVEKYKSDCRRRIVSDLIPLVAAVASSMPTSDIFDVYQRAIDLYYMTLLGPVVGEAD